MEQSSSCIFRQTRWMFSRLNMEVSTREKMAWKRSLYNENKNIGDINVQ